MANGIKFLKKYFLLYLQSLLFVWETSKVSVLLMLITVPLQALLPSLTIYMTNEIINFVASDAQIVMKLLLIWSIFFLLSNIVAPFNTMIQGKLTDLLTYHLNYSIMEKSSQLQTIDYFEKSDFYNDIHMLSSESSWRPVNLLVFGTSILSHFITFCSMLWLFQSFHVLIVLAMIISLIPQGIIAYRLQQQAFETLVSNSEQSRKLEYYTQTVLSATSIKDVRLYNLYPFFLHKYQLTFDEIRRNVQDNRVRQFILSFIFLLITTIFSLASFIYVVLSVKETVLPIGSILVFSTSVVYAVNSIFRLVSESSLLYDTLLYMEKYFKFVAIGNSDLTIETQEAPSDFHEISFQNLTFSYSHDTNNALQNINFTVSRGEKIAIVGENGAGKTTLIKLLCRFYNLTSGDILFDGCSISLFNYHSYRKLITAIFQDFSRFDLSIRENVSLSNLDNIANDISIKKALLKSGIGKSVIEDLDVILGKIFENSKDLSGGQWQKIALARAFFSDAPILILDEPTAAIDAKTEFQLFQKFLNLTQGKTVFYITHRLSSVKQADKILVLRDGEVHGFGTHEYLMKRNPYYREMYEMQSSLYFNDTNF